MLCVLLRGRVRKMSQLPPTSRWRRCVLDPPNASALGPTPEGFIRVQTVTTLDITKIHNFPSSTASQIHPRVYLTSQRDDCTIELSFEAKTVQFETR